MHIVVLVVILDLVDSGMLTSFAHWWACSALVYEIDIC